MAKCDSKTTKNPNAREPRYWCFFVHIVHRFYVCSLYIGHAFGTQHPIVPLGDSFVLFFHVFGSAFACQQRGFVNKVLLEGAIKA